MTRGLWAATDDLLQQWKFNIIVCIATCDAAKTNRVVFRRMLTCFKEAVVLGIIDLCMMHQVSLSVGGAIAPVRLLGPVFCGSNLLRQGQTQTTLVKLLHAHIDRHLECTLTDSASTEDRAQRDRILDLLHWDECMLSGGLTRQSKQRDRLEQVIQ